MSIPHPTPPPCSAPKGFFCSNLYVLEHCPESYYCRGGLLPPVRCPDGKWSPAGSAYLSECGSRMETEFAVVVALFIVFSGLCLCFWAYLDWTHMFGTEYQVKKTVCVYDPNIPTANVVCDGDKPLSCAYPGQRTVTAYPPGRPPVRYVLIPGTVSPV